MRQSLALGEEGGVIFVDANENSNIEVDAKASRITSVLALSTNQDPFSTKSRPQELLAASPLEQSFLKRMLKWHPRGGLWYFHDDGSCFTSDNDTLY
jgi:hypothetical protein